MRDWQLLRQYVEKGSNAAFALLVERYMPLVYSTCLRELGDIPLSEDVTQAVFLLLARKAPALRTEGALSLWLFQTARLTSKNALRQERRRQKWEQRAIEAMGQHDPQESRLWNEIEPLLHEALASLRRTDREAILLRFFSGKSLKETGEALGVTEDAARMRIARAIEKVRRHLLRKEIAVPAAMLTVLLTTRAVQAAPAACATSILQHVASPVSRLNYPGRIGRTTHAPHSRLNVALIAISVLLMITYTLFLVVRKARQQEAVPSSAAIANLHTPEPVGQHGQGNTFGHSN